MKQDSSEMFSHVLPRQAGDKADAIQKLGTLFLFLPDMDWHSYQPILEMSLLILYEELYF